MALFDMGVVTLTLLVTLFSLLTIGVIRLYRKFRLYQDLPGCKDYSPLFGNLHKIPKEGDMKLEWVQHLADTAPGCRKMLRHWHGPFIPVIIVYHPDTIEPILKHYLPKPRGLGTAVEYLSKFMGNGLVCVNDRKLWQRKKKILSHGFHAKTLASNNVVFNKACDVMMEKLSKKAESGEMFEISEIVNLCIFEGILRCTMDCGHDVQSNEKSRYYLYMKSIRELLEGWTKRVRTPWMWPDFVFNLCPKGRMFNSAKAYVQSVNDELIKAKREALSKHGLPKDRRLTFIELLLTSRDDQGQALTDQEVREEVDTFMAAGYDTTATAVPWLLYNLAKHTDYQNKVQAELDALRGDGTWDGSSDADPDAENKDHINWHHLSQLPILTQCTKETNRLYPPIPFVSRVLPKDTMIDNNLIPKGTTVIAYVSTAHRHPDVWKSPLDFVPERFAADEGRDNYAYIPFSAGPRSCIGQSFAMNEVKVITGRILKRFNIHLDPKSPPVKRSGLFILKPANGIWIRLSERVGNDVTTAL